MVPVEAEKAPSPHTVQLTALLLPEYRPVAQLVQPPTLAYLPAGQTVHTVLPVTVVVDPPAHAVHAEAAGVAE